MADDLIGKKLFDQVTEATGLPNDLVAGELRTLLRQAEIEPENMSLDDLRRVLAEYVQDILLSVKDEARAKAVNE